YQCENQNTLLKVSTLPSLPDDKGTISLLTNHGLELETVNYSDKMHSAFIDEQEGISLERISSQPLANQVQNWHSAASNVRATPGAQNSQHKEIDASEPVFSADLQIFSPDNDGYDDVQIFKLQFPDAGYFGKIFITNDHGAIVKNLAENVLFETTSSLIWNGESENLQALPIGIYFAVLEAVHPSGKKLQKRVRFVLARL
ncbi:MAG TPA: hypothetical protein DCQ31_13450, partial [Bacteroidales bacterium]|nr:hypothetical protein [Bacteroidales bacterium]